MAFKFIHDYTTDELNRAIEEAKAHLNIAGIDFYTVLKGFDSYFERRRRRLLIDKKDGNK